MTIYNFYTIRELAPQQHECFPDMNFGYNAGRIKNRIYLPDTFVGATYYFYGEFSNRYGTSQLDDEGHPYIDINFNNGEIGNGTVFIIAGKRYCTFQYTLEYVNVFETEIDTSEIDTSNLVTKQTFDNTVERIDNDIITGDTANRTAIDQLTAATNQRFVDVNTKLSGYDEQIGAVDTEVKNLASEVDGYSTDIAKAVADATDAKSVAEGAADDAATADAAAKEAQDSVAALDTRVGAVENSVETAETTANEAKSAAQTAQTTAGEAQTAASGAKSRADEAHTLAETAQSNAEGATTKATTAQSTANGVKTRVDTIEETTIPGINSRVEALQAGEETLNKSIELLSGSVETVEENYNTLSDSVGLLTTQVESNTNNITELQRKADRTLISNLQLVASPISNVDNFFSIPFNALSVEFRINIPGGSTINGSIIGVSYYSSGSAIASQLIATQNMAGRDAMGPPTNSLLLKLDLVNQSAILCKNVAVSNNSELQEASDVYGNTYFKNAGISGNGMIRGVAFKFTGLGTPTVSALAVTAQVGTRYDDTGGSP